MRPVLATKCDLFRGERALTVADEIPAVRLFTKALRPRTTERNVTSAFTTKCCTPGVQADRKESSAVDERGPVVQPRRLTCSRRKVTRSWRKVGPVHYEGSPVFTSKFTTTEGAQLGGAREAEQRLVVLRVRCGADAQKPSTKEMSRGGQIVFEHLRVAAVDYSDRTPPPPPPPTVDRGEHTSFQFRSFLFFLVVARNAFHRCLTSPF